MDRIFVDNNILNKIKQNPMSLGPKMREELSVEKNSRT